MLPLLVLTLVSVKAIGQQVPARPDPPRLVNDLAHVMTADQVSALEDKLNQYDRSSTVQIVVVTVPTTGDLSIEDYALGILRQWGVGDKKNNNGVVVLADMEPEHHKVTISTGYGIEGVIPDVTAKQIIENEIVPNFRDQGNYYRGFDLASDALIKASQGEYHASDEYANRGRRGGKGGGGGIFGLIIFIIIILAVIGRGGRGGGGGMYRGSGILPFILGSMIGSAGRGWGGGGGGGGWSGGGGGGGGFGGFGGGSGGGGGASGSW